jgi:hypothetical protein
VFVKERSCPADLDFCLLWHLCCHLLQSCTMMLRKPILCLAPGLL